MTTALDPAVRVERHGPLGIVTLDRPAALNALTLGMVRALQTAFDGFAADASVKAVLMRGAGGKAFCAGGDVRALRAAHLAGGDEPQLFFAREYRLDLAIHRFAKPVVCWMDGIVMGGGMGLAQGARLRIATPRTRIAMPEVGIGFFPDVGGSWFLPRLPGALGLYLGLTGRAVGGADAIVAGLADCLAGDIDGDALVTLLATQPWGAVPDALLLRELAERLGPTARAIALDEAPPPDGAQLPALRDAIDRHFGRSDVAGILASLAAAARVGAPETTASASGEGAATTPAVTEAEATWSRDTLALLRDRSPLAVRVTFEQLRRGRTLPIADCFAMELALTDRWLDHGDFIEGVRALLVDKDNAPRWRHARIEDVTDAEVAAFFQPATAEVPHA
ncbi:enoyl-CoA hydratase/isomerase family protein [Derxia gummosa]|uniref:3-hydroxyisobutyryl-CoA hydrolase n=1 Tax=Derxia gummosa DSM 723 TaxID=1121388 RepID=A0A8B6X6K5_9BURK|nr:enoyl-CoA hydratase/isomerase family protein [Derxia gummosa]